MHLLDLVIVLLKFANNHLFVLSVREQFCDRSESCKYLRQLIIMTLEVLCFFEERFSLIP